MEWSGYWIQDNSGTLADRVIELCTKGWNYTGDRRQLVYREAQ